MNASDAEVYVTVHIDIELRDDQNPEDRFELAIGRKRDNHWGDSWWLSESEVRSLRDRLDAALNAYAAASHEATGADPSSTAAEPRPEPEAEAPQ